MASPIRAGGYKEKHALKEAIDYTNEVSKAAECLLNELTNMRQASGRPNYDRAMSYATDIVLAAAKAQGRHAELRDIRAQVKQAEADDETLAARVADLEAQFGHLVKQKAVEQGWLVGRVA